MADSYLNLAYGELSETIERRAYAAEEAAFNVAMQQITTTSQPGSPSARPSLAGQMASARSIRRSVLATGSSDDSAPPPPIHFMPPANAGFLMQLQARIHQLLTYAQWIPWRRNLRRANVAWTIQCRPEQVVAKLTTFMNETDEYQLTAYSLSEPSTGVKGVFYTPAGFVDALTFSVFRSPAGCAVEAWSESTSFVPASLPLSPLWSLFAFWVPFDDWGQNLLHLMEAREYLTGSMGGPPLILDETVKERGNYVDPATTGLTGGVAVDLSYTPARVKPLDWAPTCSFLIGVALATAWVAMCTSIEVFTGMFGASISYQMQFFFLLAMSVMGVGFIALFHLFARCCGSRASISVCVVISCAVNAVIMFLWPTYEFDAGRGSATMLNGLAVIIGGFTGLGVAGMKQLSNVLPSSVASSIMSGVWSAGIVNLCYLLGTGWSTDHPIKNFSNAYWVVTGVVVCIGFVASLVLFLIPTVTYALARHDMDTFRSAIRTVQNQRSVLTIVGDVSAANMAVMLSNFAGTVVFVHLASVPHLQPHMVLAWVFITVIASIVGHKWAFATVKGYLPLLTTSQSGVLFMSLMRCGFLPIFFAYIKNPGTFAGLSDGGASIANAAFVIFGAYTSAMAYRMAWNAVPVADRPRAGHVLSCAGIVGCFGGLALALAIARTALLTSVATGSTV